MKHITYTIGCIGLGNMGGAILAGLSKGTPKENILGFDKDSAKCSSLSSKIEIAQNIISLVKNADVIILAVKPDIVPAVLSEIKDSCADKLIISIAAGVTIGSIESVLGAKAKIIRAMPNTPAMVSEGMTVLAPNKNADGADTSRAEEIFEAVGKTLIMPEKYLNAVTALSGSGPAYIFSMIQAMTDAGVKLGIPRDKALLLSAQTVRGSAEMVLSSGEDPISLRGKVTSPGGTTIAAVHIMERAGFNGIMMDAIDEANNVAVRLGEKK
jgi:pyrroline-5-carboxylate reductase